MNEEEFLDESELELGDVEAAGDFVWQKYGIHF